jgi:hypothetical protein
MSSGVLAELWHTKIPMKVLLSPWLAHNQSATTQHLLSSPRFPWGAVAQACSSTLLCTSQPAASSPMLADSTGLDVPAHRMIRGSYTLFENNSAFSVRQCIWSDAGLVLPGAHDMLYIGIKSHAVIRDRAAVSSTTTLGIISTKFVLMLLLTTDFS